MTDLPKGESVFEKKHTYKKIIVQTISRFFWSCETVPLTLEFDITTNLLSLGHVFPRKILHCFSIGPCQSMIAPAANENLTKNFGSKNFPHTHREHSFSFFKSTSRKI